MLFYPSQITHPSGILNKSLLNIIIDPFGSNFWTHSVDVIFVELSCSPHEIFKYDEIISFMECLQKTFSKKNTSVNLCPKFTLEKTKLGCISMIIIENML